MDENNFLDLISNQSLITLVLESNQYTEQYGLTLNKKDTEILLEERKNALKAQSRIEFSQSILPKIIYTFCDSSYINQDNYVETLARLQETFYLYKNEMMDEITDDELLNFMKEQFESICYGDLEYLEETCLDIFAQAVRAGYEGYRKTEGRNEYGKFDEVQRWDKELYLEVLRELCWR